ncbi:MAG: tetratricopeptide repeat protein [Gammaproteobacteria bacterium]|nr:tetratricopeptide repeat protein [Gammaproteobacteria bacterium]
MNTNSSIFFHLKKRVKILSVALLLSCISSISLGAESEAFAEGVTRFKSGDYSSAIKQFEKARNQGNDSAALHYNLGVSYYKTGTYSKAESHFKKAGNDPEFKGLAYYNLGLVTFKKGDKQSAVRWFQRSQDAAQDNTNLSALAARQINKLTRQESKIKKHTDNLSGFITIGSGRDDNVNRGNDDVTTVSNQADRYLDFYATANYRFSGNRKTGNTIKASIGATRYNNLDRFDETLTNVGLYHHRPLSDWKTRYGIHYYHNELNGRGFQKTVRFQMRADKNYARIHRLRLQYEYHNIKDIDPLYAFTAGSRQRLRIENSSKLSFTRARIGYILELNNRDDFEQGDTFTSHSPTRHTLYASLTSSFNKNWSGRLDLEQRHSKYNDDNIAAGINLGTRKYDRTRITARLMYAVSKSLEIEARYRRSDRDSNVQSRKYISNITQLSLNYYF